jgi:hypothetical protein
LADVAGVPSGENPVRPVPAIVLMLPPSETLRILELPKSAI